MTHARRAKRSLLNKNACTDSFAIFEIDQRARASRGRSGMVLCPLIVSRLPTRAPD
jgi:hypothetical protein